MKKTNNYSLFTGIVLIIIGIILVLKTTGVITIPIWEQFGTFWPIGLILAGVAFMLRAKALGVVFIALTLILGGLFVVEQFENGETRELVQEIAYDSEVEYLELVLDFGAGDVSIVSGNNDYLVKNMVNTSDVEDPSFEYTKDGNIAKLSISREGSFPQFARIKNEWDITVSSAPVISLDLDYGATSMEVDLKELKTEKIDIDSGATSTKIIFGSYATTVNIDAGASDLNFEFPSDVGVMIDLDGGAVSADLDGFKKTDGTYYSDGYDDKELKIYIDIDAGATSIKGKFYEVEL
jgi:hypothetical protein